MHHIKKRGAQWAKEEAHVTRYCDVKTMPDIDISPSRFMKITMNVLPCFVEKFDEGQQTEFQSLLLNLNERKVIPFRNFTQFPDCLYDVYYIMTLIEKENYLEEEIPPFSYDAVQPDPSFVSLDVES